MLCTQQNDDLSTRYTGAPHRTQTVSSGLCFLATVAMGIFWEDADWDGCDWFLLASGNLSSRPRSSGLAKAKLTNHASIRPGCLHPTLS